MPTNITDADTFTATVQVPSDGEPVNSANRILTAQDLADRTRYLKNRQDEIKEAVDVAIDSGTVAYDALCDLTITTQTAAGYSLSGGNKIQVPIAGKYMVHVSAAVGLGASDGSDSDGASITCSVEGSGSGAGSVLATRMFIDVGSGTSRSGDSTISTTFIATVVTPATDLISLKNTNQTGPGVGDPVSLVSGGRIYVSFLSE